MRRFLALVGLIALAPAHGVATTGDIQVATAIRAEIATVIDRLPEPIGNELHSLYAGDVPSPLWIDSRGHPSETSHEALRVIAGAAAEGLNRADYGWPGLDGLAGRLEEPLSSDVADRARFDVALSAGMLQFLRHVHQGRVDPRLIGFQLRAPTDRHDFAAVLRAALERNLLRKTVAEFTPPLAQYRALRDMLPRYRALAADPTLEPLPAFGKALRPGDRYVGLSSLYHRLRALDDLPLNAPPPGESDTYGGMTRAPGVKTQPVPEDDLVAGVKHFQIRHGLEPDGIIGKATQAALAVPLTWRVRQIELALERLRWLPHVTPDQRLITLNIPMFRLWAWDAALGEPTPALGMDVIVGRALSTETPVFTEDMREIIFRPYWNVPTSILRNEVLPALQRSRGYLDRQNMEIVRGAGDNATPVAATAENLALLRQGVLRLRQRPGPGNSLGLVKFVFPNDNNVYMHATPAQALFTRSRRDFSHGCVRVADPVALAVWALRDQPEWTEERIRAAMNGDAVSVRVPLIHPIEVILFYTTAAILPDDGGLHFADDIYRHDIRLDHALRQDDVGG